MSDTYAPILISVYNRLDHLKQCIASLQTNSLSIETDLYVVSDAAFVSVDNIRVRAIRDYLTHVKGFRRVVAINRDHNLGSYRSIKEALNTVIERHGRVIFLEDDNVVAPNFLEFVNTGLDFYAADSSIFSISGYQYRVNIPESYPHAVYAWQGFSAWGVGIWFDRWQTIDWCYPAAADLQWGKPLRRGLDRIGEHVARQMQLDIARGRQIIDVMISYFLYRVQKYSVFPVVSKVRNVGHDGTGEHGHITDVYAQQIIDTGLPWQFVADLKPDKQIDQILRRHFSLSLRARLALLLSGKLTFQQKQWLKRYIIRRSI